MSELPPGVEPAREPEPAESASGIVLGRRADGAIEVLLGLRSRGTRFLPGHLAFPGGRLDPADVGDRARCASRELLEETGIEVAPERWSDAGERVTPPMFPLRFRTRFFVVERAGLSAPREAPSPDEIESLEVARPADVLASWARGAARLPPPVLPLLRELAALDGRSVEEIAAALVAANATEERAPRIEFSPDIWVVPLRTETLPPATHTNVWMPGGHAFAIVDPGATEPRELERLERVVARRRALGGVPRLVLLTHHHRDHAGGALDLARSLGLPLAAHPSTLDALAGSGTELLPLEDGAEVDLDGMKLRVLHTPGHAPGHLAFRVVGRGELIAGDLVSSLSTILIDPEGGDMGSYLDSLMRVAALDCQTLLPGHGAPVPARAIPALIEHRRDRERKVLQATAAEGPTLAAIASSAYDDLPAAPRALVERQTLAHLLELERVGRVVRGLGIETWRTT